MPGCRCGARARWACDGGWLDLDPTNDLVPGTGHVRVAVGRDFGDVTPLRGVIRGGGRHTLTVGVQHAGRWVRLLLMRLIDEEPRDTMKPRFDEMHAADGAVREHYRTYDTLAASASRGEVMQARRDEAEMIFRRVGITFAVYGAKDEDGAGTERLIPFDLIPRVIPAASGSRWKPACASA